MRTFAYIPNRGWTSEWVRGPRDEEKVARLICGFVDSRAHQRLAAAGVDKRLGPCVGSALTIIGRFEQLPKPGQSGF